MSKNDANKNYYMCMSKSGEYDIISGHFYDAESAIKYFENHPYYKDIPDPQILLRIK